MRRLLFFCALILLAVCSFSSAQTTPPLGHVVVVALENHSYSSVVGSSAMPYLNSLISQYSLATGFYANTHPSIGNYFELTTGQIITNNDGFSSTVSVNNIERELLNHGKTWKSYAQSIPYIGDTGGDVYPYIQHHNPFAYFSDNRNGSGQQNNIVPFSQFASDVANGTLPNFSFVAPDIEHDAHDCPGGGTNCADADTLWAADQFLQFQIAPVLNSPQFQKDGLLVIWWDESYDTDTAYGGGRIAVALVGPTVKHGYRSSTFYQHQNLLRTLAEALGTGFPGASANAANMAEFFTNTATPPPVTSTTVTVLSPAPGATVGSPVTFQASATSPNGIDGWVIYADNNDAYQVNNGSTSLTASVSLAAGTHSIMIRAWDKVSGYGSSPTFNITVASTVSAPPPPVTSTTVKVLSPAPGASVGSPVTFQASATSPNGIDGWVIYVDGNNAYQVNNGSTSLTASVSVAAGTHSVMIRAWDKVSGFGSSPTFNITVASSTSSPPPVTSTTVTVLSPGSGATVSNPVTFTASATSPNGIDGWVIYADNNNVYQANNGSNSLSASVSLSSGAHTILVRAWDKVSGYGTSAPITITVR